MPYSAERWQHYFVIDRSGPGPRLLMDTAVEADAIAAQESYTRSGLTVSMNDRMVNQQQLERFRDAIALRYEMAAKAQDPTLAWWELENYAKEGRTFRVNGDTFQQRGEKVHVTTLKGDDVWPRGYASVQAAARARGVTREELSASFWEGDRGGPAPSYKTPAKVSEREQALNAEAARIVRDRFPKEHRPAFNGPVRALVGALNRQAQARASQTDGTLDTPETVGLNAEVAVDVALEQSNGPQRMGTALDYLKEHIQNLDQSTRDLKSIQRGVQAPEREI